jgi:hypothetical protein
MSEARRTGPALVVGAAALDVVLVVAFAVNGRSSHAEVLDAAGIWGTAWPFLAGLVLGWLAAGAWRHPLVIWPTAVAIWASTLVLGMLIRFAAGGDVVLAFVIVAALTLALFLLGRRGIALLARRLRRARRAAAGTAGVA